ncbi:hypothetical protein HHI36_001738 [Cryptolaemus montrouzieri]|uniref:Uncharacterized protein n=1 Tax=Cryptolaemus montrouzieri TaxID=559131 RepID=A0ABD2P987_9CUCU
MRMTNSEEFGICAVSVQCLTNKKALMEVFLKNYNKCDILCVTEHWCNSANVDMMQLQDYEVTAKFMRQEHTHGGALIYAKRSCTDNRISPIACDRFCVE